MTKKERVLRTIRFEETDRIPVYDLVDNNAMREYYGGAKLTPDNAWQYEFAAIRSALDMTRGIMIPNFEPGKRRTDEDGFVTMSDENTTWLVHRPFDDVEGLKRWVDKDIDRKRKWQPDVAYVEAYRAFIQRCREGIGDDTVIVVESDVGLEYARDNAGIELFSYLMAEEPALVSDWLETLNDAEIRRAKAIADPELVPVMLTYTDIAYKCGPIFSPAFYRREFFPRLKRLNNAYQNAGVKCLFHSDGNLMSVMDDLVAADIDGLNPLETMAGMSVGEVRRRWPKLFLTGGIDVSQLMAFGSPDEVREACVQAIRESGGVGYFLGSTTELHPAVKVENILAMVETARTYKQ